ncbi:CHAT domain-containing protein [Dapis sp. BLCC M126]|uniref:CHAT domain-containing protein n=1 Tax=Dapis sp. BLCC M126 TaxID=3400189 RepID=UPI003CF5005A
MMKIKKIMGFKRLFLIFFTALIGIIFVETSTNLSPFKITTKVLAQNVEQSKYQAQQLKQQATELAKKGELEAAKKLIQQSLKIYQSISDRLGKIDAINSLGQIAHVQQNYQAAVDYFENALTIAEEINNQKMTAWLLNNLGWSYEAMGEDKRAFTFYKKSLIISQEIGDLPTQSLVLDNLGRVGKKITEEIVIQGNTEEIKAFVAQLKKLLETQQKINPAVAKDILYALSMISMQSQQYHQSIDYWKQYLELSKQLNTDTGVEKIRREAVGLEILGNLYITLIQTEKKGYPEAREYLQESLALARQIKDSNLEAQILANLGQTYWFSQTGEIHPEYGQGIEYLEQALTIAKQNNNQELEVSILNKLGSTYQLLFMFGVEDASLANSYEKYQQILQKSQATDNPDKENLSTLKRLGMLSYGAGKFAEAIDYYQQALKIAENNQNLEQVSDLLYQIAIVYQSLGDNESSLRFYQRSLSTVQKTNNPQIIAQRLIFVGDMYLQQKNYQKAIESYQQSWQAGEQIKDSLLISRSLSRLGQAYYLTGDYERAISAYQNANKSYPFDTGSPMAFRGLGAVYHAQSNYQEAIKYYQQAWEVKSPTYEQDKWEILLNMGVVFADAGNLSQAEAKIREGIKLKESVRRRLGNNDGFKISFFDTFLGAYGFLQKLLIAQNKNDAALEVAEQGRARAFVELLAQNINPENQEIIEPPKLAQIQQIAQQQNATIVEYSLVSNKEIYIWVINPQGKIIFRSQPLKNNSLNLTQLVTTTRQSLGVRGRGLEVSYEPLPDSQSHLKQLHQLLIEPIADLLPTDPQQKLIFIPQNSLFSVPFPALVDKNGKYLIEKHTILTAPSIQVLQLTHEKRQAVSGKDILVVGNPTMPNITTEIGKPPEQLSSLPGAETEAIKIAKILKTQPLIGSAATKKTIAQQLANARVIHFATHGLLEYGIPEESGVKDIPGAIALAPSGNDNGLLTSREIFNMKLNAELVVLSACDTGRGDITGDGVIGLSRSLVTAGVPSVIVSLWSVPDAPTAELMTEFYQEWEKSGNKAEALRQAMLKTMKSHQHPRNWAAFTLIGEAE